MANKRLTATLVTTTRSAHASAGCSDLAVPGCSQASCDQAALALATQTAARDYVEIVALFPKDKAAHKKAHARYKDAQAVEIRAISRRAALQAQEEKKAA